MDFGPSWIDKIAGFMVLVIGANALYCSINTFKLYDTLFEDYAVGKALDASEQIRLDRLLEAAKKYYNLSIIASGISLLISSLVSFTGYVLPFGEIQIPKIQTVVGLNIFVIGLLILVDRYFLMALPWIRLDTRRPPYDLVFLGLSFDKKLPLLLWFSVPLFISSLSTGVVLGNANSAGTVIPAFYIVGIGLILFPRTIYYFFRLTRERLDHRGGNATLSMYLLYRYRLSRQFLYTYFLLYLLTQYVPPWNNNATLMLFRSLSVIFSIFWMLRFIAGIKVVYTLIDKLGPRYGFPVDSPHYNKSS